MPSTWSSRSRRPKSIVGPFKADILAKRTDTTDDHWVLIENQLERTDHRHLGQLLTYAAGLEAATIVWVAESFCEEHRAALDWLNDITSDKFEFFGLEIELWQIGDSPPAPMFNVAAQPNEWARDIKQSASASGPSDLKLQQQRYWQGVRALLLEKKSKVRPQKAHPQHWADYAVGRSGTWMSATVNSPKKYVSVEFNLRGPPEKVWYEQLEVKKAQIDAHIPGLSWQRLDGRKQSRLALYLEGADPADEAAWPAQHAWIVENLERLLAVFRPLALDLTDGPEGNGGALTDDEGPEDA